MKVLPQLILFALVILVNGQESEDDPPPPPPPDLHPALNEVTVIVGYNRTKDDNYRRFLLSARTNKIKPIMIKPLNINIHRFVLAKTIQSLPDDSFVLYSASPEILFTESLDVIRDHFLETNASILFVGDKNITDASLTNQFPEIFGHGLRFLSSQVLMGYAGALNRLFESMEQSDDEDQVFFVNKYLTRDDSLAMKIDHYCEVFQWIDGENTQLQLDQDSGKYSVMNEIYWTNAPLLIARGAQGSVTLNRYTDYLNYARKKDKRIKLKDVPTLTLAVIIPYRTPFMEQFWSKLLKQSYPKNKIDLVIIDRGKKREVESLEFTSITNLNPSVNLSRAELFELALDEAKRLQNSFYFCIESSVHLDNAETLSSLVSLNKTLVSPLVMRQGEKWSNFWGEINENGFYKRSFDYLDIVNDKIRGVWNVPYVTSVYLIKKIALNKLTYTFNGNWFNLGENFKDDADMTFCNNLRKDGIHMHVSNLENYGHLIANHEEYSRSDLSDDLFEFYELERNPLDWAEIYIHPDYWSHLNGSLNHEEPCQDVFRFQIVTEKFCDDIVRIMEDYGKWSNGDHKDERVSNGYENVPTRDIHMKQVGLNRHWDEFLSKFVRPLQQKVFAGYNSNPPKSVMQFVVRYRADEQPSLRPHNDASTYTISIALNNAGVDFQGGGVRFLRYDCSITDTKKGSMIMHPGRLTHHHEGLQTTDGTRYILVTFVDP